jgi:predicted RNase H-like HicB family nuclease
MHRSFTSLRMTVDGAIMRERTRLVVYEESKSGWAAYVPDLPGVVTTGRTRAEVRSLIQEAIEFHLDGLKEDRLPIPEPSAETEVISISR